MTDTQITFSEMKKMVDQFLTEREWYQFHSPAADSRGPVVESSELLALFLYSKISEGGQNVLASKRTDIEDEFGDVCTWLMCLANIAQIEPSKTVLSLYLIDSAKYETESTISDLRALVLQKKDPCTIEQAARNLSLKAADFMIIFLTDSYDGLGYDLLEKQRSLVERCYAELMVAALIFADGAGIDFSAAFYRKLEKTKQKYPVEKAKGKKAKYNEL